jgi:hypothetical protein
MSPIDSLKKIIDVEDRTTRHEMFKRWVNANICIMKASFPVVNIKKVGVSQRDEIVEALAADLSNEILEKNYVTITHDDKSFHAIVTFLKRIT